MDEIIRKATKAPSAVNMQPWRFLVVESKVGKEKLRPFAKSNTRQNDSLAAMIIIFGDLKSYKYGEEIYNQAVSEKKMDSKVRDAQLARMIPYYENLSSDKMKEVVTIDASLVAMQLMLVARSHGYDTCQITDFEPTGLVKAFDLDEKRFYPMIIIPIGKAKEDGLDSVRLNTERIRKFI